MKIPEEISKIQVKTESFRYSPVSYPTVEIIRDLEAVCSNLGMRAVIVIDNFYNFGHSRAFFDAYLCSLTTDPSTASLICITLPKSIEKLGEESPGLYQRLSAHIELDKFSQEEIKEIIEKRIESVRIKEVKNVYHPFTEGAVGIIVENADGNAREAIRFAQEAINNAAMNGIKTIDKEFMLKNIIRLKKTLVQRFLQKYGEKGEKIIKYLIKNDGRLKTKELGMELNMRSSGHISYYLNQLIEDGLIERIDKGRYKVNLEEDFKKEFKSI
jgi:Holliday junction resolvasome RuvABC ATP-dependent DNA helicase subunit